MRADWKLLDVNIAEWWLRRQRERQQEEGRRIHLELPPPIPVELEIPEQVPTVVRIPLVDSDDE
jgi:hypothetical protein